MRRTALVLVLAVAAMLGLVAPASAGAPPRGLYECTISGAFFGDLKILKDGKYERNDEIGKFTFKGRKLSFNTGGFKGFKGRWYMATGSGPDTPEIALRNPLDDFEDIYCGK
ncbi:MAG: hypothetical protein JJE35_00370 [Thermoleophilia bacterium]|nr:hypothetical protein [Thermoleophilia bacterium]